MKRSNTSNKSQILDILTKSFDDNKSTNWAVKSDKKRKSRIRKLMLYAHDICKKQDGVFISDDNKAAIIFDFPRTAKYGLSRLIQDLKFIVGVISPERLFKVLKRESYIKKYHPKDDFIYLWFLGVDPESQGKGVGGALLNELVLIADNKKIPIYLETSNPRNLTFYKKFGFSVYHEWNSDFMGFPVWFMKR